MRQRAHEGELVIIRALLTRSRRSKRHVHVHVRMRRGLDPEPAPAGPDRDRDSEPLLFGEMGPITATEFKAMTRAMEARFAASKVPQAHTHGTTAISGTTYTQHVQAHINTRRNTGDDLHLDLCNTASVT